ncbi:MAG: hypothetical protein BWX79_00996 [Alphaproteobacteria bacterium ADurb.Bin100]|nr:MAG: hypothetical protein BWX79_00996 [Alphaproteobacteria bacterium ADurb.Bin100]
MPCSPPPGTPPRQPGSDNQPRSFRRTLTYAGGRVFSPFRSSLYEHRSGASAPHLPVEPGLGDRRRGTSRHQPGPECLPGRAPVCAPAGQLAHLRGDDPRRHSQGAKRHARVAARSFGQHRLAAITGKRLCHQRQSPHDRRREVRRPHPVRGVCRRRNQALRGADQPREDPQPGRRLEQEAAGCRGPGNPSVLDPSDADAAYRRHRAQDRACGHQGRHYRRGEGPPALRLDRGQHVPRAQGARLRRGRHQDHAGNRQPGR